MVFESKLKQSADMVIEIALAFGKPVLITTDSWFGNNGLWKPLYKQLGSKVHMVSRLRSNLNIFDLPFSTDTTLSVEQIVEYYGARWKIESGFKELKQETHIL